MQEEMLLELFSVPVGLKKVVKVDDVELYTSDSLTKNFLKALLDSEILQTFSEKITSFVNNGKVIPCYINRGIIKVFLWKFLSKGLEHKYGSSLAFFSVSANKVYVIIDNNISYAGFISNDFLAKLIIHELVHMASFSNRPSFLKLFSSELGTFYSNYFNALFKFSDISKEEAIKYVSDLMMLHKSSAKFDTKKSIAMTDSFLDSLQKKHKIPSENFGRIKSKYMYVYKLVLFADRNIDFIRKLVENKEVILPFVKAYRKSFGIDIMKDSVPFQEIIEPSEVICEYSQEAAPREKVLSVLSLVK